MKNLMMLSLLMIAGALTATADDCKDWEFPVPVNTCVNILGVDLCWTTTVCVNKPSDWLAMPAASPIPESPDPWEGKEIDAPKRRR